jgi:hypothetical protein
MPLFNNAAIAASFKTSTNLNLNENDITGKDKKIRNRTVTSKSELMKQEVPIGVTVLQLVLPMTKDDYYTLCGQTTDISVYLTEAGTSKAVSWFSDAF